MSTSSVSNMVRLEEKGELFFSLSSQGFSTDTKPSPRSLFKPTPTPPLSSESAAPLTCTTILQTWKERTWKKNKSSFRSNIGTISAYFDISVVLCFHRLTWVCCLGSERWSPFVHGYKGKRLPPNLHTLLRKKKSQILQSLRSRGPEEKR